MPFSIGENVGPYRIVAQLGQGGMATVYKAYHAALDRYVAIKVLHPAFMEDPNFLARFEREAKVIARLEHPNIVPIYDYAEHAGQPYLVMKFIEGETLKARLARGPLSVEEGLRVVEAVGAALSYAHERGILHRDIKPSNVLLSKEGPIYLADFGLARIAQAGESTLSADMMLGTPQYISPEQARGERELDEGTDIYSFGVVLYELVTGRVPFNADTPFSIIHDHIYTPLPLPHEVNGDVPEAVERVLLKALAKSRADRYEKVSDLVAAFREAVVQGGVAQLPMVGKATRRVVPKPEKRKAEAAAAAPGAEPTQRKSRLRSRWWLLLGVGLLACACVGAFLVAAQELEQGAVVQPPDAPQVTEVVPGEVDRPADQPVGGPVAEARATVAADPEDPDARRQLAEALFDRGQRALALQEAMLAADLYADQERWLEAAELLSLILLETGGPEGADPRAVEKASRALFMAAEDPAGLAPVVENLWNAYPDWPLLPTVAARGLVFLGDLEAADGMIQEVLAARPGDPLANTVLAELRYAEGAVDEADALVEELLARPRLPGWLVDHLHELAETHGGG